MSAYSPSHFACLAMVLHSGMMIQMIPLLSVVKEGDNEVWDKRYSRNEGLLGRMVGRTIVGVKTMVQRYLRGGKIDEREAVGQHAVNS
jgi:hypothetical protein